VIAVENVNEKQHPQACADYGKQSKLFHEAILKYAEWVSHNTFKLLKILKVLGTMEFLGLN
jgi:hypothetical protein